jgi:hypothetical protein
MAKYADFPQETYVAMQRIRETALIRFDSLFTSGKELWSLVFTSTVNPGVGNRRCESRYG